MPWLFLSLIGERSGAPLSSLNQVREIRQGHYLKSFKCASLSLKLTKLWWLRGKVYTATLEASYISTSSEAREGISPGPNGGPWEQPVWSYFRFHDWPEGVAAKWPGAVEEIIGSQ